MELETEGFDRFRYFRSYTVSVWIFIPLIVLLAANFALTILTLRAQKEFHYALEDFRNFTLSSGNGLLNAEE